MRTEFGHPRSVCDCDVCKTNCRFMPGYLIPADLDRMIPTGADPKQWAEQNLLASPGARVIKEGRVIRVRTLVPATKQDGSCIHLTADNSCAVHAVAPFGCAFFDCKSEPNDELARAGLIAVMQAWNAYTLYARLWKHLDRQGLNQHGPNVLRERMRKALNLVSIV
jgi:hypothetical protein